MIYHEFDKYGVDAFKIELVEEVEFEDRCELHRRENHYISATKCCNKYAAPTGLTSSEQAKQRYQANKEKILEQCKKYREANQTKIKQYRKDNKDKIKELNQQYYDTNRSKLVECNKQYYAANKDKISEHRKEKYNCECGSTLRKSDKAAHEKTKKHQKYIINLST